MSEPTVLFHGAEPGTDPVVQLRAWPPDEDEGDLGFMYDLDVLGISLIIRDRADGLYIHVDTTDGTTPRLNPDLPVLVEVNNAGENAFT